ncbi:MAG: peptidase C39 family protein [Candidatus Velthaea sp.]
MLKIERHTGGVTTMATPPSDSAIVSWNCHATRARIELRVHCSGGRTSGALPYMEFAANARRSLNGRDATARIETDVLRANAPIVAVDVLSDTLLDAVALSTRVPMRPGRGAMAAPLDVPALSQYLSDLPSERGWCSPAALAMLLAYWQRPVSIPDVARAVYDDAYGGTGNWAFNVAFAASFGLRAVVVHLAGLAHAAEFIAAGIPLAVSYAWTAGALPGAPLESTDGHLGVLRGFSASGDALLNDPAQPTRTAAYPREAFEHAWLSHGGVAYAMVPVAHGANLARLANA